MATKGAAKAGADARPIVIRRIKKVAGGHHGGAWKVAYADFVTAMMAFFMLLWLLSSPDKVKLKGLAEYFTPSSNTAGFGPQTGAPGAGAGARAMKGKSAQNSAASGVASGGTAKVPDASLRVLATELRIALDSATTPSDEGKPGIVAETRDGLRITLMDNDRQSMFRSGTAELNPYARALLARVAQRLAHSATQIAIEGHTDGTGGQSDANWQLSGGRALAARSALIAAGMAPERFSEVVALGATQPVYPEQPDRPENRRITVVVLGQQSALPSDASFKF